MRLSLTFPTLICLSALGLLLTSCGPGDYNEGFGESKGFGGPTKGFGDVDGYGNTEVGLCSYLGGCMPDDDSASSTPAKKGDSSGHHSGGTIDGGN